eukprot:3530208-Rhodomonas_salina.1
MGFLFREALRNTLAQHPSSHTIAQYRTPHSSIQPSMPPIVHTLAQYRASHSSIPALSTTHRTLHGISNHSTTQGIAA